GEAETWVFHRSDIPLYPAVMKQLETRQKKEFVSCPIEKTSSSFIDSHPPRMAIAFGDAALQRALTMTWDVPILALFTEKPVTDRRVTEIEIPQPHHLQIELLKKIHGGLETIWYPFVGEAFTPPAALGKAAAAARLNLVTDRLDNPRELPKSLKILHDRGTATILPPDPALMNDAVIRPVLLAAFRSQTAVVGFSEGLVRQGAAFAYVLTPEQLGEYLADLVTRAEIEDARLRSPVPPFAGWNLILNVTMLDKLQLSPSAEVRNAAAKRY
ncbi:MAG TPA: hypothetical protein PLP29_18675, partial [Candidatus Ozemobacteraceae bacterium]|nr:hypothetical protein [Candidatus Ozemobacteraceae bacterium]